MYDKSLSGWQQADPFEGGMSMGDGQVSDDLSRQWARRLPDGTWQVWTVTYAVIDYNERDEDRNDESPFAVDERWEWITCTDPDEPGSTELDSGIEYGEGSYLSYSNMEDALNEARRMLSTTKDLHLNAGFGV